MKQFTLFVVTLASILGGNLSCAAQDDTEPKGWLFIPSIELYKPVYFAPIVNREHDLSDLGNNIAHLEQTNWITDGWGRTVLAGHTPGGFELLSEVELGAVIIVGEPTLTAEYTVTEIHTVDPSEWEWLAPVVGQEDLMLITCAGDSRLIVIAVRVE